MRWSSGIDHLAVLSQNWSAKNNSHWTDVDSPLHFIQSLSRQTVLYWESNRVSTSEVTINVQADPSSPLGVVVMLWASNSVGTCGNAVSAYLVRSKSQNQVRWKHQQQVTVAMSATHGAIYSIHATGMRKLQVINAISRLPSPLHPHAIIAISSTPQHAGDSYGTGTDPPIFSQPLCGQICFRYVSLHNGHFAMV